MSHNNMLHDLNLLRSRLLNIQQDVSDSLACLDDLQKKIIDINQHEIFGKPIDTFNEINEKVNDIIDKSIVNKVIDKKVSDSVSPENLNEKLAKNKDKTPVENFADSKIDDLRKSFNLNQKLSYIKHLFDNKADAYNKAIEDANNAIDFNTAVNIIIQKSTDPQHELMQELISNLKRRFL